MPPSVDGQWQPAVDIPRPTGEPFPKVRAAGLEATDDRGIFVLHSVMLHTGKLLWFSGHTEFMHYPETSYLFDPATGTTVRKDFPVGRDFFCCHYVQMADGRIVLVGGADMDFGTVPITGGPPHGSMGAKNIVVFDPVGEKWIETGEELRQGRWYPTPVLLGDGRVAVFSGRREFPGPGTNADIATEVEIINPPDFKPKQIGGSATQPLPIYPGLHLAPDGRIFFTNTCWGQEIVTPPVRALTITGTVDAPTGSWDNFGGASNPTFPRREEGMSVLLPPAGDGKILLVGGSEARGTGANPILNGGGGPNNFSGIADPMDARRAEVLDTKASPPKWADASSSGLTNHPRINGHLVLLPTRQVLLVGGHDNYKWNSTTDPTHPTQPTLDVELYTPGTPGTFTALNAPMAHPRMYHSTATLLPDGRVIVTGGADANSNEPTLTWPGGWPIDIQYGAGAAALNHKSYQIYEPPYLHNGTRPTITDVKRNGVSSHIVVYGESLVIETAQGTSIDDVHLMRPGAPTHHTDTEQRLVPLTIDSKTATEVHVTVPAASDSNVMPPGYYFLWIVDSSKRPCQRAYPLQVAFTAPPPAKPPAEPPPAPPGAPKHTHWCPCTLLQAVLPGFLGLAQIAYLRMLRTELEASDSALARRWMAAVNQAYWFLSPPVARWLGRHDRARRATGELVVGRLVRAVLRADRRSRRWSGLVARLTVVGLVATLLAPFAALGVAARSVTTRGGSDGAAGLQHGGGHDG